MAEAILDLIRGEVTAFREPTIPIRLLTETGKIIEETGNVDTSFSGFLSLPPKQIAEMDLRFAYRKAFTLGDSSEIQLDLYDVHILWDGEIRRILAVAAEGPTAIGTSLLSGFRLFIDVVDGGEVIIETRS